MEALLEHKKCLKEHCSSTLKRTFRFGTQSYAQHGKGRETLDLFARMKTVHVVPNGVSFVAVLIACAHSCLVNEAVDIFTSMERDYKITPEIIHQNCMVDAYSRANRFQDAKKFALAISVTWKILLGACKNSKQLAVEQALLMEPRDPAVFVMLANLYSSLGLRDKQAAVWKKMEQLKIQKVPGLSYVELFGEVHELYMADDKHLNSNR